MKATLMFALIQIKRNFRDKTAMFFTLFFPLIFLFIFGTIFGSNTNISFNVALINNADNEFAAQFVETFSDDDTFGIIDTIDLDDAKEKMSRGEVDSIIELPVEFGIVDEHQIPRGEVVVYYDEGSPEAGQTLASIMTGVLDEINASLIPADTPLTVTPKSTGNAGLSQFDYTFAGLLAFTLMTMSIFGLSNQLPAEKKTGALRRIKATPFRPYQLIIGMMLSYLVLTMISAALMVAVGVLLFDFEMQGSWLALGLFAVISTLMLSGFGMVIAGWARNENQSAPLSQVVAFPMMFLSGVFFPRFLMPDWLQSVTSWIPLTPVGEGVRMITTEGADFIVVAPQIGLIVIWGAAIYLLAFKVFRWE